MRRRRPRVLDLFCGAGGSSRGYDLAEASAAMGIDWMTLPEITQAIPPTYTGWIGAAIMPQLGVPAPCRAK